MKYLLITLTFIFILVTQSWAQSPSYYFNVSSDTAIESNAYIIAGYVKTDTAPTGPDSVVIILRSGSPYPTHMDTTSSYVINFSAGQDSVAFVLHIMKDTFPEHQERVLYVLRDFVNGSSIGADSSFLFVLIDTTPPAIITYMADSGWAYLHADTFTVCETVNNPNPFYIRFHTITHDAWYGYPGQTAYGGRDYFYNWDTIYAPPGLSSYCENITIVPNTSLTPLTKTFLCVIQNLYHDDNITDSFEFTIVNDNYYTPPSISFDTNAITVRSDSASKIGIPITIVNDNYPPYTFTIDTPYFTSNININANAISHFTILNSSFTPAHGTFYDTVWVSIPADPIVLDTVTATLSISNVIQNTSPDTLFNLTIVDSGRLYISFLGAGLSHLKSDSIGYVQVYTSSATKYPISVDVSYLTGNAIRDTDFTFHDTIITFPAFTFDTIPLPVVMLQDHRYQGNTQVVLQLTNVNPSTVQYGITQYTYIIIDNVDSGLPPLGLRQMDNGQNIRVYPNPFDNEINIQTTLPEYKVSITNSIGQVIYDLNDQKGNITIDFDDQPTGLYFIRLLYGDKSYTTKVLKL
jgi:hypothetical protein